MLDMFTTRDAHRRPPPLSTRCVFLDRDGVINESPAPGEYIRSETEFRLLPNTANWIRLLNALEFLVIVITNQRGVALRLMSEDNLARIHRKMLVELAAKGARIDDVFYCPHAEDSCECRKPKPGLVYAARDKWNIDLAHSLLMGDSDNDEQLAAACGLAFVRVVDGHLA
jgi:D-glycero-D-manno-heptose 1,7-bisphosphate phosphatase